MKLKLNTPYHALFKNYKYWKFIYVKKFSNMQASGPSLPILRCQLWGITCLHPACCTPAFLTPISHPSPLLPGVEGQGREKGEARGRAGWAGRSASWRTEGIRREGEEAEGHWHEFGRKFYSICTIKRAFLKEGGAEILVGPVLPTLAGRCYW